MTPGDGAYLWQSIVGLRWAHTSGTVVKVALTPAAVPEFISLVRSEAGALISLDNLVRENIRRFGAGLPLLNVVDKKEGF